MITKPNRPGAGRATLQIVIVAALLTIAGQAQPSPAAPASGDSSVKPFKIDISDSILEDLRARLDRTRFPDQLDGVGWDYGTDLAYLKELVKDDIPPPLVA